MSAGAKFSLEQIITAVRALWAEAGIPPLPNAVRKKLGGGDPNRLEFGISLVGVEYGINCAFLDGQPAEIRALVVDPRGPNGMLPLDPLTRELLPEGALAGALTQLRAIATARENDQRELEHRVAIERARADAVAVQCEARITAALAAQLSAEQLHARQDAAHERDTRDLREQLATALERVRILEQGAPPEVVALTDAVTKTGAAVNAVSQRLKQVERLVSPAAATRRPTAAKAPGRQRTTKAAPPRGVSAKTTTPATVTSRKTPAERSARRSVPPAGATGESAVVSS
jgi:hypothetical protein